VKDHIPNQRGDYSDYEIHFREEIVQGEGQTFPLPVGNGKFSHQEI
jgi:hypothetical protein